MAFFGESRPRALNFARDSGAADKAQHLERLRQERQEREAARRRWGAAVRVQAVTRSHLARVRVFSRLREEYDAAPPATLLAHVRPLGYFFDERRDRGDRKRLTSLATAILAAGGLPPPTVGATGAVPPQARAAAQARRLARATCKVLSSDFGPSPPDALLLLHLLTALLPTAPTPLSLAPSFVDIGVFRAIRCSCGPLCLPGDAASPVFEASLELLRRVLEGLPPSGGWGPEFVRHILAIPDLAAVPDLWPRLCGPSHRTPADVLSAALSPAADSSLLDEDAFGWRYANLLGAIPAVLDSPAALGAVLRSLAALSAPPAVPRLLAWLRPPAASFRRPKIDVLLDAQYAQSLFLAALASAAPAAPPVPPLPPNPFALAPPSNAVTTAFPPPSPSGSLCGVYGALLRGLTTATAAAEAPTRGDDPLLLDLLAPISYSPTLLPALWHSLSEGVRFEALGTGPSPVPPGLGDGLLVFSLAYARHLAAVDEEEFYDKQTLFKLDEVVGLVAALRSFVFNAHHNLHFPDAPLKDAASQVLRRLCELDAHRRFCPANHFTVPVDPTAQAIPLVALEQYLAGMPLANPGLEKVLTTLHRVPFLVPFEQRVHIFRGYVHQDADRDRLPYFPEPVRVRRATLFEDAYGAMSEMPAASWKGRLRVEFVGEAGFGDGVTKEFLTELSKTAFSELYGMFLATPNKAIYPNPAAGAVVESPHTKYRFLGRLLGKALYEGILVDIPFARFFVNALLGLPNKLMDVASLDPSLYRNFLTLKHYTGDVQEDFGLNFTVVDEVYGEYRVRELIPGGTGIPVTNRNRLQYLQAVVHYRLNTQIRDHAAAMREGLFEIVTPAWLELFGPSELQTLISGDDDDRSLDVGDWAAHTVYGGGYGPDHRTIRYFWDVVAAWPPDHQRALLRFATSVGKPPLLGFRYMHPPFNIHLYGGADTADRLPTAATCMCQLKLPPYADRRTLEAKLLYAISADCGFELS